MPALLVFDLPSDFVTYLTRPGLETMAGSVPLKQYVCLNTKNGGNARIDALLSALRGKGIRSATTGKTIDGTVGANAMTLVWKGQGHPDAFVGAMNFLCDNQDQLKGVPGELGRVYDTYFKENRDVVALKKMVAAKYFGIDCIGFVANWLQYVDLWSQYNGYEIDQWDRVFVRNVTRAEDVAPLNLMVWPGSHVALVDWVHDAKGDRVEIDMCQSSSGGPQTNEHVFLKKTARASTKGYPLFEIAGGKPAPPVTAPCYLMSWPNLHYEQPPTYV